MTTHYQKIQALGNRMASNLETMGVSASFSDGGLTLADKILQIQRFNDGIILYGDKSIAQSSDTINLYALLLDDGKPVSGETVGFVSESALKSLVANGQSSGTLDEDYYVTVTGTGVEDYVQIGSNSSKCIAIASSTIILTLSGSSQAIFYDGNAVNVKNGILTYTDTNNTEQTVDISEYSPYNILNLKSSSGAIFKWYSLYATTGSDGVASKSYACTGAGLKSITAKSGSLQSAPYTVTDCILIDDANAKWYNQSSTPNNFSEGVRSIQFPSDVKTCVIHLSSGSGWSCDFDHDIAFEFDIISNTCDILNVQDCDENDVAKYTRYDDLISNNDHILVKFFKNKTEIYLNGNSTPVRVNTHSSNLGDKSRVALQGRNGTVSFSNLAIYPI